jgi:hypothetical protein
MPRDNTLLNKRNELIKARYTELIGKKYGKRQLYSFGAVMEMLSEEFFLTSDYIAKIINK